MSDISSSPLIVEFQTLIAESSPILLLAKVAGAFAGSLISIAYVLPRGQRDAMLRLTVGVVSGLVFGGTVGVKAADLLGLLGKISLVETMLMGAALASLCAWWGLGVLQRLAEQLPARFSSRSIYPTWESSTKRKDLPK